MKKLIIFTLLTTATLFAACGDSKDEPALPEENKHQLETPGSDSLSEGYYREGSLVYYFYEPETLTLFFDSPSKGFEDLRFFLSAIKENGKEKTWTKGTEQYQEHIEYYGDTLYPQSYHSYSKKEYQVSAMPLNSINITADKDFDAEHPAGASLNDLFVLKYSSAYNVIKSNYDSDIDITFYYRDHYEDALETMTLSDFKPLDLLYYETFLYFNKLPEELGTYEFSISFDFGKDPVNGREVKVPPAVIKAEFTDKDYVTIQ